MHHTKFQPNIPSLSGEKVDLIAIAIFNSSSHFAILTRLNFIILKPCSLSKLNVKSENYECSGFREKVILMDLNARVHIKFC